MAKYVPPTMEIFEFESEDIITASNVDALLKWAEGKNNDNQDAATAELAKAQLKEFGD